MIDPGVKGHLFLKLHGGVQWCVKCGSLLMTPEQRKAIAKDLDRMRATDTRRDPAAPSFVVTGPCELDFQEECVS